MVGGTPRCTCYVMRKPASDSGPCGRIGRWVVERPQLIGLGVVRETSCGDHLERFVSRGFEIASALTPATEDGR